MTIIMLERIYKAHIIFRRCSQMFHKQPDNKLNNDLDSFTLYLVGFCFSSFSLVVCALRELE